MPPVRFEPAISADERPQTYALDRAATGTGGHEQIHKFKYRQRIFPLTNAGNRVRNVTGALQIWPGH
jgi:hypothetical protein